MPATPVTIGPARAYRMAIDKTLTTSQSSGAVFKGMSDFRSRSNPTLRGYKTGYHESAITTDHYNYLKNAIANPGVGKHTLSKSNGRFFNRYHGTVVDSSVLQSILELGDTFRTDTAQTILSAPNGLGAGHSGSNVTTIRQADAHNLLRNKVMDLVILPETTKGLSKQSLATIFAAITITSIAPAEIARTISGGTANLKGGAAAKQDWEKNRNEAKSRVKAKYDLLSSDEQDFVMTHAQEFMKSTQIPSLALHKVSRLMDTLAPVSPRRDENYDASQPNEVAGLGYDGLAIGSPVLDPPINENETGAYMTQTFRTDRIP